MKIRFLGTGSMGSSRKNTAFVINDNILFDIGNGTLNALRDNGLDTKDIDTMIISHFHCDHFADIIHYLHRFKIKHLIEGVPRKNVLKIIGPVGLYNKIDELNRFFFGKDFPLLDEKEYIEYVELEHGKNFEDKNIKVTAFEVNHVGICNGYIVEIDGKKLLCSGDTATCDSLISNIEKSDTIVVEALFAEDVKPGHIALTQVEELAKRMPDKKFFVVHRADYDCKSKYPNIFFPMDDDVVEV